MNSHQSIALTNIGLLKISPLFRNVGFVAGYLVPLLGGFGLSVAEVLALQSIFGIAVLILEIPTGYIADRFGRANSIRIGYLMCLLGNLAYFAGGALHGNFVAFVLAEVLLAFGFTCMSGADTALLHRSVVESGNTNPDKFKELRRQMHRLLMFGTGAMAVAAVLIARFYPLSTLLLLDTFTFFVGFILMLKVREPWHEQNKSEGWKAVLAKDIAAIKTSFTSNKPVKELLLMYGLLDSITLVVFWMQQPYFQIVGIPVHLNGAIFAILLFTTGMVVGATKKLEKSFGLHGTSLVLFILALLPYFGWAVSSHPASLLLLVGYIVTRANTQPLMDDELNRYLPENLRATFNSLSGLSRRGFGALMLAIAGLYVANANYQTAFALTGISYLLIGSVIFWMMHRKISGMAK